MLNVEVPVYDHTKGWQHNRQHHNLRAAKIGANQEKFVLSKREALCELSNMIAEFKAAVGDKAVAIQQFAKDNDIEHLIDFEVWDYDVPDLTAIANSDPIQSALSWMASTQDC
ncbi:hypothetical protein D3C79_885150 [compost metagenome]